MPTKKTYKIGTRGSLLALTQCSQIKEELEKITNDHFELEIIKTKGDLITNTPLWQIDGKDFFSKELDDALLSRKVDLVVHSYKDLGSSRPEHITLAAITKRSYSHDILLIKKSKIKTLPQLTELNVGTSSPRRMTNIEEGLKNFLPFSDNLFVKTKILRGNVNSRISKLLADEYDAIVIALAGLERLSNSEKSRQELCELIKDLNFMILPQSHFTSSSSQGALAIECLDNRTDSGELLQKLKHLDDPTTREEIHRERKAFNSYGGGCHLPIGINVKKIDKFFIHRHRGRHNEKNIDFSSLEGRELPMLDKGTNYFNGHYPNDLLLLKKPQEINIGNKKNIYVTSRHCLHAINKDHDTLWAAGSKTMRNLAKLGFWVNGCSDSIGDELVESFFNSSFVKLLINNTEELTILSHTDATSKLGKVISCYKREVNQNLTQEFEDFIKNIQVFYWTSFHQYEVYVARFPEITKRYHVCGIGKTYQNFKDHNIEVIPFSSMDEFKKWIEQ